MVDVRAICLLRDWWKLLDRYSHLILPLGALGYRNRFYATGYHLKKGKRK
jgi:hypothetical protein